MKVLKFGGTSVGSPERMAQVKEIITLDNEPKIVVLSAVSGTTNSLVQIAEKLYNKNKNRATTYIDELYDKYTHFVNELYTSEEYVAKGVVIINRHFEIIKNMLNNVFTDVEERLLLAQGELMSTQMFTEYMRQEGYETELLWSLDFMSIDDNDEPELAKISVKLSAVLEDVPKVKFYITQGFICTNLLLMFLMKYKH